MNFSFPANEEKILQFWKENKIFQKSVLQRNPRRLYSFYDGPPFATGTPHYGHILASVMKDAVPRFWTMRGYRVERRWGWDCHGLPIENLVEQKFGLKNKNEIEQLGIEKFNRACRENVLRFVEAWKQFIPRIGRWVDMDHPYKTMDLAYMESVWWAFQQLWKKGLVYQGYKSMHLCPHCGTVLSNFEVNLGYKAAKDIGLIVKFPLINDPHTSFLVWTTTAWTLPGNVALAVNPQAVYVKVRLLNHEEKSADEFYILARERLNVLKEEYKIIKQYHGQDLAGVEYEPPFNYFYKKKDLVNKENGWKVYLADFVTLDEGTGIVHIAPAFGEEDLELGKREKLPFIQHVTPEGRFSSEVEEWAGEEVKPKEDSSKIDKKIVNWLKEKGKLFIAEEIVHNYPFCWRCDTPLLNYATSSWFVKVTAIKDNLIKNNQRVHWVPEHIKYGRFGKWLEGVKDWSISRSRYWGTPLPIWECPVCHHQEVIGSLVELKEKAVISTHFYYLRHGEAESNKKGYLSCWPEKIPAHLTPRGRQQISRIVSQLQKKKIELIISSDLTRTKETAQLVAKLLGIRVIFDKRLREINFGIYNGKPIEEYERIFSSFEERYNKEIKAGETLSQVRERFYQALREVSLRYKGKNILVVSHQDVLATLLDNYRPKLAEWGEIPLENLPHNEKGEIDLHRPYIDRIKIKCPHCGAEMKRIPEVFDCWFESGSMPYARLHYPFENKEKFRKTFPAQFVAEGIDQTRGWFYTLMVLSTALFNRPAFMNVIVNGIVLAEDGQKMSKRLKNYPDPRSVVDKYGADALRFYLLSSPAMRAEDLNFSEKGIAEVLQKILILLYNIYKFYRLYAGSENIKQNSPRHLLDKWIISRLNSLTKNVRKAMESYELVKATRELQDFIDDWSHWYLRRSRERLKRDKRALGILGYTLYTFAKVSAPFIPFFAEYLYQELRDNRDPISVHLTDYPREKRILINKKLETAIEELRKIVSFILAQRINEGIKVRQPLQLLKINPRKIGFPAKKEFLDILKEEVNVKEVILDPGLEEEFYLDTRITPQLQEEGYLREILRRIQNERKNASLVPQDKVILYLIPLNEESEKFLVKYREEIINKANAEGLQSKLEAKDGLQFKEIEIDRLHFQLALSRALNKR